VRLRIGRIGWAIPSFAKVPRGLIDKAYASKLAAQIVRDRATAVEKHGTPPGATADLFDHHTTHIAAADAAGNWVAITATINLRFGSKVIVPGTGVLLNNEMDDFSIQPGVPNAFGLVGAEANAIAPGKRPLSSMSPTIVLKNGKPILTVGAAGGPRIITQAVLTIVNQVDREMDLPAAVAEPRFHHQWRPDLLYVERPLLETKIGRDLVSLGHAVAELEFPGVSQAVGLGADGKTLIGVADPRYGGKAVGR
jgi:gamma-glutamyltranspeptidase/glutathione hydrolase